MAVRDCTFTAQGKQVLFAGSHYADACDETAARAIVTALNDRPLLIEVREAADNYLHAIHRTSTWLASQRLGEALKATPSPSVTREGGE